MNCPRCYNEINIVEQIKEANENYYEGIEPPVLLMIECDNCEVQTIMVDFVPMSEEDFEDVESPALNNVVSVPKSKQPSLFD